MHSLFTSHHYCSGFSEISSIVLDIERLVADRLGADQLASQSHCLLFPCFQYFMETHGNTIMKLGNNIWESYMKYAVTIFQSTLGSHIQLL